MLIGRELIVSIFRVYAVQGRLYSLHPVDGSRRLSETAVTTYLDCINPKDGGNKLVENVGVCLPIDTAS
jgi:hypothetical protein